MIEVAEIINTQPDMPSSILRKCQHCEGPMLLMSVLFHSAVLITKRYQCYVCKADEVFTDKVMVDPPGTAPGKPDCQPSRSTFEQAR